MALAAIGESADDDAGRGMRGSASRRPARTAVLGWACALALVMSARGRLQEPTPPAVPDVQKLGPQVGTRVPDFALLDQNGRSRTLTSLMGPNGLMLVFFRSADW